jgi:hypothetical protein
MQSPGKDARAAGSAVSYERHRPETTLLFHLVVADFSLHAGVAAKANERQELKRLYRYISRPAVSEKGLSLTAHGQISQLARTAAVP